MSLPQKNKYSGVSQNIQQQARGPHSIQHRGPTPVQVSRAEDYRQLHNYSLRGSGGAVSSAGGGGPVGAHDMSKTLGSQGGPPGTTTATLAGIYASAVAGGPGSQMGGPQGAPLAPPPASQAAGPPPGVVQGQHMTPSLPHPLHDVDFLQPYYAARQGQPPQVAPPQVQPPQVQGGQSVQGVPQGAPQGGPQRQVSGGNPLGRPPPTVQGALGPMGLPANSPQGPPLATAYSAAQLLNYQGQPTAAYQAQHIPQQMIISNCAPMPLQAYQSQRASQFSTAPQLFYQPYVQHPQQAAMYYTPPQMQMTMGGAGVPPAAQAPRGQHTPPAGATILTSRSKRPLAIVDPSTGRNILEDKDIASPGASAEASRSTPPTDAHSSASSDIAGVFAAQVAAAAASTTPLPSHPSRKPPSPPVVATPEPPPLPPQEPPVEKQLPEEGPPPAEEEKPAEVAEEEEVVPEEEVDQPVDTVDAETVVERVDRTPVVVGVEEKLAAADRITNEPVEAVTVPEASAATVPVEAAKEVPEGRESKKASKKKKMKEWNKKGESKEGGDMDAFVVKEEVSQQAPQPRAPTPVQVSPTRTPTPPVPAPQAPPADLADAEDEEHRRQVVMKNEENIRVSREAALKEEVACRAEGPQELAEDASPPAAEDQEPEVAVEDEEEEEGEAEEEVDEEGEEEEETAEPAEPKMALKYNYREDQWSPLNPEGRKMYDRSFLLELQGEPMSLQKPYGLPDLDVIKDTVTQHRLPDVQRYPYPAMQVPGGMGQGRAHPDLFMPSYARNGVARPPMGGGGGGGGGVGRRQSQPGRGGEKPKKVIMLSSSLNQEVKLHSAEKAWKPKHKVPLKAMVEDVGAEELYRKVRGILNKLTPQKFQSLVEQVRGLEINSEERLNRVIDLVFEKALDEPNFSVPYANMCKQLAMFEVPMKNGAENQMVNFRKLLLLKCQREFEKDTNDEIRKEERLKQIEAATSEEEKNRLVVELAEDEKRFKRRSLGNIRFIGELYNLNMLTAPIMFDCLRRLLNSKDEDSLECLCKLLITIGKELDNTSAKGGQGGKGQGRAQLDDYFRTMESIVKKREVSLRVVFMLQDVIDLRMRKWVPRRDENIPKTIDQIHEEAQREQVHEKLLRETLPPPRRDDRGDRGDRGDRRKNRGGGGSYDDGGWNTVPSKKHVDVNKLKQINTKPTEMDSIQLGPASRMSSWAKGSSGGSKAANQEPETRPAANRFSALAEPPAYDSRRSTQRSTASSRESSRGRGSIGPGPTTPSGVRKVPSQSRERDSALAAVKNLASLAPSQDAETPAASSTTQPTAARDDGTASAKESDLVLKGSPTMDEDLLKTRTEALVDQFLCNSDFQDAVQNVTELVAPSNVIFFISTAINHVLERSQEARTLVGQLLKELVKKKVITLELFTKGLHEVLQYGEDMELDIPKVWEYVAELLVPLFQDSWLPLSYLREASEPCRANGRAARMVASVLTLLAKAKGEATVANLWLTSSLQWSDFLGSDEDVDSFLSASGVSWAASSPDSRSTSSMSMAEVEAELNLLICVKKAPPSDILVWIEKNLDESFTKKPQFIRALVSVIAKNAITVHRDGNATLNADLLKSYIDLLQRYLDNQEEHELQALYGLQALMNRLEHPKGILVQLFNSFYDGDLISEDAFMQWKQSEDPAEQEGKGVALKSATSFFTWLSEMDGESGEED